MATVTSLHGPYGPDMLLAAARQAAQEAAQRTAEFTADAISENSSILRQVGLLSAPLPPDYGGAGLGTAPNTCFLLGSILRLIGSGNVCLGRSYEEHANTIGLICRHGGAEDLARLVDDVNAGHLLDAGRLEHA